MLVLETERLSMRWVEERDSEFIMRLLNEPGWLKYIGDKGIHTLDDAVAYIKNGPQAMYEREGFGLFVAQLKENHIPIGLCGLIKRDGLKDVDIGYAILSDYHSKGYAYEAARGMVGYAKEIGLKCIVAFTTKDNQRSYRLLEKLGMKFDCFVTLPNDTVELKKYGLEL
ncbi:GNAT family N-acetyltransferase [Fredinandcohnia sp. 179-A 10B2 NHS]|uniref:GNAT family N-acetyltransferase n=1 Tax=Fredinandcohnia sp. 179-A 10B2 NHS TaxID=3235176 RepID=UPI0039A31750